MELVIQRHQQKLDSAKEGNSVDFSIDLKLDIEIIKDSHSSTNSTETYPGLGNSCLHDENLAQCDYCGEETTSPELGFKCLHCNCIFICSNCETSHGKHSDHLLIACMPRCAYNNVN